MTRYILSSAVIPGPGFWHYSRVTVEAAKEWLTCGPAPRSTVGYEATAAAFEVLFGFKPEVLRAQVRMRPGDEGLVFRLRMRADPDLKPSFSRDFVLRNSELGLLVRYDGVMCGQLIPKPKEGATDAEDRHPVQERAVHGEV